METTISPMKLLEVNAAIDNAIYYYGEYRYLKALNLMEDAHGAFDTAKKCYRRAKMACTEYNLPMIMLVTLESMEM